MVETAETEVRSQAWTPEFDVGRNWRARLGFVLISNDATIEDDMRKMAPEGVGLHFTRAAMPNECTVASLGGSGRGRRQSSAGFRCRRRLLRLHLGQRGDR
jgi:maleate isomerase